MFFFSFQITHIVDTNLYTFDFSATANCPALNCEYKCQASPTGGTCYCPEGRKVSNDTRTCIGKGTLLDKQFLE